MALSGLASGFDWKSIVDQLIEVSRAPQNRMRAEQQTNTKKSSALDEIRGKVATLQSSLSSLSSPDSFLKKAASIADKTSNWTATATSDTPTGDYNVELMAQATTTIFKGRQDIGRSIDTFNEIGDGVSGSWLGATITAGTFTVNGVQISVNPTEKWDTLINRIESATSAAGKPVMISWNLRKTSGIGAGAESFVDDKITITSGNSINPATGHGISNGNILTLGSATDTSNILQVLRLYANGTSSSVTTSSESNTITDTADYPHGLGMVRLDTPLRSGSLEPLFANTYQGGPYQINQGTGTFQVNGKDITYDTTVDTIQTVLDKITNSDAGVYASYDRKYDQIILQNKKPGNVAINIGTTGDSSALANALGLIPGPPEASDTDMILGQNATFRINGGGILQAQSSTLTETDHGIKGLTINANSLSSPNPTKITVAGDNTSAKEALNNFIKAYNDVQNTIENYTKVTVTGSKVTSAILAGNQELRTLSRSLRSSLFQPAGNGTVKRLSDLGVNTTGIENTISLTNATALESKLASASSDVTSFLQAATTGFVARFKTILGNVVSESGSAAGGFKTTQQSLTKQNTSIDKQIEDMERRLTSQRSMMEASFIAMERAQAGFQQQAGYLAKAFAGNSR